MARYNQGVGMWVASDGTWHHSKEAAEAAEAGGATVEEPDLALEAGLEQGGPSDDINTTLTPEQIAEEERIRQEREDREALSNVPLGTPVAGGGTATTNVVSTERGSDDFEDALAAAAQGDPTAIELIATFDRFGGGTDAIRAYSDYNSWIAGKGYQDSPAARSQWYSQFGNEYQIVPELADKFFGAVKVDQGVSADAAGGGAGGGGAGTGVPGGVGGPGTAGRTTVDAEEDEAKGAFQDEISQNQDENATIWADARSRYDSLQSGDYELSDEARAYQQEGLQMQRDLMARILDFDRDQYATQFQDRSLARMVAAGRSQPGGYAAQQAGINTALEQAPALFAEGARQADAAEAQRLNMAGTAAKNFGELGTMTRGQDENRAQFEADFAKGIADSVANLTQGQVQMNQQESQMFAEIWTDFAQLQSVYANMSSAEQIAWWRDQTARRGQDKTFDAVIETLKAQGAVSDADLIGGLFQLGGGLLGAAGQIGAAFASK